MSVAQWLCGLTGHDFLPSSDEGLARLRCQHCGLYTPGFESSTPAYHYTQPGLPDRHRIIKGKPKLTLARKRRVSTS